LIIPISIPLNNLKKKEVDFFLVEFMQKNQVFTYDKQFVPKVNILLKRIANLKKIIILIKGK